MTDPTTTKPGDCQVCHHPLHTVPCPVPLGPPRPDYPPKTCGCMAGVLPGTTKKLKKLG